MFSVRLGVRLIVGCLAFCLLCDASWGFQAGGKHDRLTIDSAVLFSELDGSANDLDGASDGVLTLNGLLVESVGVLTIDVPAAQLTVAGDVMFENQATVQAAPGLPTAPSLVIEATGKITLENDASIDLGGGLVGGVIQFCSIGRIWLEDRAVLDVSASASGGVGGLIRLESEGMVRIQANASVLANGDTGGAIHLTSCSAPPTKKFLASIKLEAAILQAIGFNGSGGTIAAEARQGNIVVQGPHDIIVAAGTLADGSIQFTAADTIDPTVLNTVPSSTVVEAFPSEFECGCGLSVDLTSLVPLAPRETIERVLEDVSTLVEEYPEFAEDLELILDKLQATLFDPSDESAFLDSCHIPLSPAGDEVFLNLTRALQALQRLVPWSETYEDPEGHLLPPAPDSVPVSLNRTLAPHVTRLLQAAALLADVVIQEARSEPGAEGAVLAADATYVMGLTNIVSERFLDASASFGEAWLLASSVLPPPEPPVGEPPIVNIFNPGDGAVVVEPTATVTGMVQDIVAGTVNGTDVTVHVNGVPAVVINRSYLASEVPVRNGLGVVAAVAVDSDGNRTTACSSVIHDPNALLRLQIVSGNNQEAPILETLPELLVAQVNDDAGNPLGGAQVVYRVIQGNGSVGLEGEQALIATTDSSGHAITSFTLGTRVGPGVNRVRATAVGTPGEVIFCALATGLQPDSINQVSGDNQKGEVGVPLPLPLVVVVTDAGRNPLENIPVTFAVVGGGGSVGGGPTSVANTNSNGRVSAVLTLGTDEGLDNNLVEVTFAGLTNEPAVFKASAFVTGDPADTSISGVVLDNQSTPVPGVTLEIDGTNLSTFADAEGQFTLENVPVGHVFLHVDASTTTRSGVWANLEFELVTLPGVDNTLPKPIYILPLDLENGQIAGGDEDVTITVPAVEGFSLTVLANSATFPDGSSTGLVSVTPVTADKIPMAPGSGMQPRVIVTIQPAGVRFDPPAPVTYPNADGLSPGTVTEMFSFDHDIGEFVSIGTGTVSSDGLVVASDPGFGIVKGGWHCAAQGSPSGAGAALKVQINNSGPIVLCSDSTPVSITATGSPSRDVRYEWSSSDTSVVTVSPTGVAPDPSFPLCENSASCQTTVTVTGPGTATVTVTLFCTNPTTPFSVTDTIEVEVFQLEITDTFNQVLPDEVEIFHRVSFGSSPSVNEIGFKVEVSNLPAGVTVDNYEWTVDPTHGALTALDPLDAPIPVPTEKMGPDARGIQFESWTGITGVQTKTVKVELTLSNGATCSKEISVKVLDQLTGTGGLLTEHVNWHNTFDPVGGAGEPYKAGYLFFRFHRRFAITDMTNYRTANGLPMIVDTSSVALRFPYPLRKHGPPHTPPPTPAMPVVATSHELGATFDVQNWHSLLHSHMCDHGDVFGLTSPRDLALYWFHKRIDSFWTTWLTSNPTAPHFYVQVTARTPGPGDTCTASDLAASGVSVTFSDPVTGVVAGSLTVGGSPATAFTGSGIGPYVFKGFTAGTGVQEIKLLMAGIKHVDTLDPLTPKRDNPLQMDVAWVITITP